MRLIKISNDQFIPAHNVDVVFVHQDNPKSLTVHSVGGYTFTNHYPDKDMCRKDYERIFNELEK